MKIENISIGVTTNADKAAAKINSLVSALSKLSSAASGASGEKSVEAVGNAAKRAEKSTKPLSSDLQKAIESATKYEILVHKAAAAQLEMGKAFETGDESAAWAARERAINAATQAAKEYEKSQPKVEQTSPGFSKNASDATSNGHRLADALKRIADGFKQIGSHGKSASNSIKSVGNSAKHSSGMLGKLWASIKRIAVYRLLRTALKDMTQAFQEGLKNAYAFSKGISGSLAQALDQLASSTGQMKNQMGAAFGELLQTIMPVIMAIVSAINQLMSALSALFAALGGRAQYLSAGESEAAGWDKASGAAKKYKNTLLGFDEINRLNDESGGGGGSADNGQGVWELSDLPDWAMKIKDAIDKGDWKAAGEALADHLNEVIDKWDAHGAGQKLGEKINNAIDFAYGFLTEFKFKKLGNRIAEFLNGAIETIKWRRLGQTLTRGFTGVFDFLIGFIERLNTGAIGNAITGFITGVFDEATAWLGEQEWPKLAQTISNKILEFIEKLDPVAIATSIGTFLSTALTDAKDFIDNVKWEEIGEAIGAWFRKAFEAVKWKELAEKAWGLLGSAMGGAAGFLGGLAEGVLGHKIEGIVQELTVLLSDASLVIGAILLFTGHIPLGLGLVIAGLAGKDKASEDWGKVPTQVQEKIAAIELVASTAMLALGVILVLTGAALPLGLGLIIAGGTMLATTASENWNKLPTDIQTTLAAIGTLVGVALMAIGIVLLLTGAGMGLGLGCILAASAVLAVTASSFDLDGTTGDINGAMESIGSTGETQFGKIVSAINGIIDAVKSVIDWFGRMKTAVSDVNNRLNDIDQHQAVYGSAWGEAVRGNALGFASGGSIENNGTLFVAGEAGAEVVADMGSRTGVMNVDQMEAAVANGNIGVINAIYGMANAIVKAVNEIDPDITLDGQSLANKMYQYNKNAATRYGATMIT